MPKIAKTPTSEELVEALKFAVTRLHYHVHGCKKGEFATCRCSHAVAVRRLDRIIKRADPTWTTELELLDQRKEREAIRDEERKKRRHETAALGV